MSEYVPNGGQVPYVYGHGLISQRRNGNLSVYHRDGLGSVMAVTNGLGAVTDTYAYDAYGNLAASMGNTVNSYRYAGEQFDASVGGYYLRSRYYQPRSGRFLSRDTFEGEFTQPLSLNKFAYVHGNPVNKTDPSGNFVTLPETIAPAEAQIILSSIQGAQFNAVAATTANATPTIISRVLFVTATLVGAGVIAAFSERDMNSNIPIIVWGDEIPETREHISDAFFGLPDWQTGQSGFKDEVGRAPRALTRVTPWDRNWLKSTAQSRQCPNPRPSSPLGFKYACDEYPYASSEPGGYNYYLNHQVSIRLVPAYEQVGRGQGNKLNRFYNLAIVVPNNPQFGQFINGVTPGPSYWIGRDRRVYPLFFEQGEKHAIFRTLSGQN
jgi:RHS repeat-associated protein